MKPITAVFALVLSNALWMLPVGTAHAEKICQPQASAGGPNTPFVYQNNYYNHKGHQTQCIDVTDASAGAFTLSTTSNVPTNDAPSGYPSVYVGCHWGLCSDPNNSGLPVQVSDIATARSSWSVEPVDKGAWDISYDIWFNSTPYDQRPA